MTTKTISTYIAAGYTLSSAYSRLVITTSGGIGGTGLFAGSYAKIFNDGAIHGSGASDGVVLNAGGLVQNGDTTVTSALIAGYTGVIVNGAAGSVANFGTIKAADLKGDPGAVYLSDGGSVTNGSSGDTTAQIRGYRGVLVNGAPGTVANFGTIVGYTRSGVFLLDGGVVANGSTTDTSALIQGLGRGNGVAIGGSGTVSNFGTITGRSTFVSAVPSTRAS